MFIIVPLLFAMLPILLLLLLMLSMVLLLSMLLLLLATVLRTVVPAPASIQLGPSSPAAPVYPWLLSMLPPNIPASLGNRPTAQLYSMNGMSLWRAT